MSSDKTPNPEFFWLYRLKQSGLFDAETPQGALLEPNPLHEVDKCADCRFGPCEWLAGQLERALKSGVHRDNPHT